MSEEQAPGSDMPQEEKPQGSEFMQELQSLGQQLTTAIKSMWESEDSRKLRSEISDGFIELGKQVDSAVKSAQESEAAKQFGEQVKETMDKAKESDFVGKMEEGLVTGLRELNTQLSKLVASMEKKDETPESDSEA